MLRDAKVIAYLPFDELSMIVVALGLLPIVATFRTGTCTDAEFT